jgi:hypothetical protein
MIRGGLADATGANVRSPKRAIADAVKKDFIAHASLLEPVMNRLL